MDGESLSAGELKALLALDGGYLSRLLRDFRDRGLVAMTPVAEDRRRRAIRLTGKGRKLFDRFNAAWEREVSALLTGHDEDSQRRLVAAMKVIEDVLDQSTGTAPRSHLLRPPEAGVPDSNITYAPG